MIFHVFRDLQLDKEVRNLETLIFEVIHFEVLKTQVDGKLIQKMQEEDKDEFFESKKICGENITK